MRISLFAIGLLMIFSCSDRNRYDVESDHIYEKSKLTLEETEKKNPQSFITVKGDRKKNLIGQTVVRGKIYNNAKVVTFKDVDLKLSFYSKTGVLLEEDREKIYEKVSPGGSISFKSKYFTPKGTDSVAMRVMTAAF